MPAFTNGQRVRIARDIDIFALGIFPAGETGTVEDVSAGSWEPGTILFHVRLDNHFEALEEWSNRLQVFADGEPDVGIGATIEDFAPLP